MADRPGLDDDPATERLVALWREGSADIDSRVRAIGQQVRAELRRDTIRAGRLQAQANRLLEVQEVAEHILDDALQQTQTYAQEHMGRIYTAGAQRLDRVPFSMTMPHRAAVQVLADDMFDDVLQATQYVDDSAKVFVRRVSRRLTAIAATTGETNRAMRNRLAGELRRDFASRGVGAVTYRDGSKHSFGEYAEMLIRTKTGVAYNAGTLNASRLAGVTHFELLDGSLCGLTAHHDPMLANGLIVDAYTAQAWPLSHPNCRRAVNPRPDLTRDNAAFAEPTVSPEARADQTAFEEALRRQAATQSARASRTRPTRPQRPSNSRPTRPGATAANSRARASQARSEAAAGNARRRAAIEQARRDAAQARAQLNTQRANATQGDTSPAARWGVSDTQFENARAVAGQIRADIRDAAAKEADSLGTWLFDNDLGVMARPARLQRRTDAQGVTRSVRTQSGYDWMEQLDDAELARVRRRFVDEQLHTPDVVAEQVRRKTGTDLGDDEAIDWLVDQWIREDGLRSVASGRVPRYGTPADLLPGDYALDGYELEKLFGVDLDDAAGHIARVQADAGPDVAARILGRPQRGPAPWEMDAGDYAAELDLLSQTLAEGPSEAARLRLLELAPADLDDGALNPFELHEEIRLLAQTAGLL